MKYTFNRLADSATSGVKYRCFVDDVLTDHTEQWATQTTPIAMGLVLVAVTNHFDPLGKLVGTDDIYETVK
jgi:hypothetical protein